MTPGAVLLNLAKASPDDFLAGLKSLSNQERVEVDRKMRQLEDKHQDEFSKDSGRREQSRRGFLSTLGLGAAGVGAAVAAKLLPGGKVVGDRAPKEAPATGLSDAEQAELDELRAMDRGLAHSPKKDKFTNPSTGKVPPYIRNMDGTSIDARLRAQGVRDILTLSNGFFGPRGDKVIDGLNTIAKSPDTMNREQMKDFIQASRRVSGNIYRLVDESGIMDIEHMGKWLNRLGSLSQNSQVQRLQPNLLEDNTVEDLINIKNRVDLRGMMFEDSLPRIFTERPELLEKYQIGKAEDLRKLSAKDFMQKVRLATLGPHQKGSQFKPSLTKNMTRHLSEMDHAARSLLRVVNEGYHNRLKEEDMFTRRFGVHPDYGPPDDLDKIDAELDAEIQEAGDVDFDDEVYDKWASQ